MVEIERDPVTFLVTADLLGFTLKALAVKNVVAMRRMGENFMVSDSCKDEKRYATSDDSGVVFSQRIAIKMMAVMIGCISIGSRVGALQHSAANDLPVLVQYAEHEYDNDNETRIIGVA